jgi:polyhydroxyalkanoate synthase
LLHACQALFTLSVSPAALAIAFFDWAVHIGNAPGKQLALVKVSEIGYVLQPT